MGAPIFTNAEILLRHASPEPNTGCWLWTGSVNQWGYGRLGAGREQRSAHRLSYSTFTGPIPSGAPLLHSCDQPACINPQHLRPGTASENMRDMVRRGRRVEQYGERASSAKLTEAAVREIRATANQTTTISALARRFGVDRRTIRFALRGDTWNH